MRATQLGLLAEQEAEKAALSTLFQDFTTQQAGKF